MIEGVYIASLVQLGFTFQAATFGFAAHRLAHYVFPIIAGGATYLTLRAGPWKVSPTDQPADVEHATSSDNPSSTGGGDDGGAPLERCTGIERRPNAELSRRSPHGK